MTDHLVDHAYKEAVEVASTYPHRAFGHTYLPESSNVIAALGRLLDAGIVAVVEVVYVVHLVADT